MNRAFKKSRAEDGFTLLELLIVIVLIGILAAIAIPVFINAQNAAHDASVKSDARNTVIGVAAGLVTKPDAAGFSVLAAGDTVAAVKLMGVPSVVVTVPTGAVAVRAVVTQSNWVTVRGTGADYVVHAQSTVDGFWYEFSSKTGKYTSSSDTPAVTPGVPSTTAPPGNSVQNPDGIAVRVDGAPVTTTGAGGTGGTVTGGTDAAVTVAGSLFTITNNGTNVLPAGTSVRVDFNDFANLDADVIAQAEATPGIGDGTWTDGWRSIPGHVSIRANGLDCSGVTQYVKGPSAITCSTIADLAPGVSLLIPATAESWYSAYWGTVKITISNPSDPTPGDNTAHWGAITSDS